MNSNNNFEVKYTIRFYDDATITELRRQYEKLKHLFKNKNEFITHLITIGLDVNGQSMAADTKKKPAVEPEEDDMYLLLMDIYKYTTRQFRKMYINQNVLEGLLSSTYHILLALNSNERLFEEKVEDGFYDDLPTRFREMIDDLTRSFGLN